MHHGTKIRHIATAAALLLALCVPAGSALALEPMFLHTEDGHAVQSDPVPRLPAADNRQPDDSGAAEDRRAGLNRAEEGSVKEGAAEEGSSDRQSTEGPSQGEMRSDTPRPGDRPGPGQSPGPVNPKPELTDKQKKELAKLYKNLYETQKKLITKYAEYGVITREQASLWLSRLESRYEKLKENGYVPAWKKCAKPERPKVPG